MSEAKHTPGPWHTGGISYLKSDDPRLNIWSQAAKGMQSGEILAKDAKPHNARLMSASPDLLAVCREMCRIMAYEPEQTLVAALKRIYDDARDAINKAEGRA